jgi:hypothetical protein
MSDIILAKCKKIDSKNRKVIDILNNIGYINDISMMVFYYLFYDNIFDYACYLVGDGLEFNFCYSCIDERLNMHLVDENYIRCIIHREEYYEETHNKKIVIEMKNEVDLINSMIDKNVRYNTQFSVLFKFRKQLEDRYDVF